MEYNPKIIVREHEQDILKHCVESPRAEFIAVCSIVQEFMGCFGVNLFLPYRKKFVFLHFEK